MKSMIQNATLLIIVASIGLASAADTPRIGLKNPPPVGPMVDVTLKTGESNKGQLVSYSGGSLTLKLDSGAVVTQDGASVVSVRFITEEKPPAPEIFPSSQVTQMTPDENNRLRNYRVTERRNTISPEEERDYKLLRTKLEAHIKALEREIPKVTNLLDAEAKLSDLLRSTNLLGMAPEVAKSSVKIATNSIENETIRERASNANAAMFQRMDDERNKALRPNRPLPLGPKGEKMLDKIAPPIPPGPPPEKSKEF